MLPQSNTQYMYWQQFDEFGGTGVQHAAPSNVYGPQFVPTSAQGKVAQVAHAWVITVRHSTRTVVQASKVRRAICLLFIISLLLTSIVEMTTTIKRHVGWN